MRNDTIQEVRINMDGSLCVFPMNEHFTYIYRTAMGVHWDKTLKCLYMHKPPEWSEWSYVDCFNQIKSAASEQSIDLRVTQNTRWVNIEHELRKKF